jgi:lactate dehydrogenase-like 2-hydroxyacid dehydrogenase
MPRLTEILTQEFGAVRLPDSADRASFLPQRGADIVAVVTAAKGGVDDELMSHLPNLQAIVHFGVGYDNTHVAAATARGIRISNTPDVLNDCVADTAVALLLDIFRGISAADRFVRSGAWERGNYSLTRRFSGSRVGILGLGRIGMAIAARLEPFGCRISYHNRQRRTELPYEYVSTPRALAERNDVLLVTASGGPHSERLVSHEVLAALGPDSYLVNIARGSMVDEAALVYALRNGVIAGAGLDVFANEPNVPHELSELDNVVLLPHLGSGTVQTRQAMVDLTVKNLREFLSTGHLVTPVN